MTTKKRRQRFDQPAVSKLSTHVSSAVEITAARLFKKIKPTKIGHPITRILQAVQRDFPTVTKQQVKRVLASWVEKGIALWHKKNHEYIKIVDAHWDGEKGFTPLLPVLGLLSAKPQVKVK